MKWCRSRWHKYSYSRRRFENGIANVTKIMIELYQIEFRVLSSMCDFNLVLVLMHSRQNSMLTTASLVQNTTDPSRVCKLSCGRVGN